MESELERQDTRSTETAPKNTDIEGIVNHSTTHVSCVYRGNHIPQPETLVYCFIYRRSTKKALGTTIKINKRKYVLEHPDKPKRAPVKHVRIFGYPLESETSVLEKAMAVYGTVRQYQRTEG